MIREVQSQLANVVDGLDVYKNAFETVSYQLYATALHIVHELILAESATKT